MAPIDRISRVFDETPVVRLAVLFGSAARRSAGPGSDLDAGPSSVGVDPLGSLWCRTRQRKIHNRHSLPGMAAAADRGNRVSAGDVDPLDGHLDTKHLRREGQGEMFLEHREEANGLLGFVVAVNRRLLDQAPTRARRTRWSIGARAPSVTRTLCAR